MKKRTCQYADDTEYGTLSQKPTILYRHTLCIALFCALLFPRQYIRLIVCVDNALLVLMKTNVFRTSPYLNMCTNQTFSSIENP